MKASRVFRCDFTDYDDVIALAKNFGEGQTVYKKPGSPTYSITHTSRADLWGKPGCTVHHQT